MHKQGPWQFDENELPTWARPAQVRAGKESPPNLAAPAPISPPQLSTLSHLFVWRLVLLLVLSGLIAIGKLATHADATARWILISAAAGMAFGMILYFYKLWEQGEQRQLIQRGYNVEVTKPSLLVSFAVCPLVGPAIFLGSYLAYLGFANRYLALLVLAPACIWLHHQFGSSVVRFAFQKLSTDLSVTAREREGWLAKPPRIDLVTMSVCFAIAYFVPGLLSTSLGIVAVFLYVSGRLYRRLRQLTQVTQWRSRIGVVLTRGQTTSHEFWAYEPWDQHHWKPEQSLLSRRVTFLALALANDLVLITALSAFVPWELFASLAVPGFDFPISAIAHFPTADFQWVTTPVQLVGQASSRELYIAGILVAVPLFLLVPPAVLVLAYFPALVELERVAQIIKTRYNPISSRA